MALIVGHNGSSKVGLIANRTQASGGSVGGVKKPGSVSYGTSWQMGNKGNYLSRANRGCCPNKNTIEFFIKNTTLHPVQRTRAGYGASRGIM
jgi:hypothetical protein